MAELNEAESTKDTKKTKKEKSFFPFRVETRIFFRKCKRAGRK